MTRQVAISSLSSQSIQQDSISIHGVVSLWWPFSSTTQRCALLLAEEDPRLRQARGQVRVRFSGPAGVAIAKHEIGIADVLDLRLHGARWLDRDSSVHTPGKSVEGELLFTNRLHLTLHKNGTPLDIVVDSSGEDEDAQGRGSDLLWTPVRRKTSSSFENLHYGSPAFSQTSPSTNSPVVDPFFDNDDKAELEEPSSKRLRTSFGSVRDWHVVNNVLPASTETTTQQKQNGLLPAEQRQISRDAGVISPVSQSWLSQTGWLLSSSSRTLNEFTAVPELTQVEGVTVDLGDVPVNVAGISERDQISLSQSKHQEGELSDDTTEQLIPAQRVEDAPQVSSPMMVTETISAGQITVAQPEPMTTSQSKTMLDRTMISLFGIASIDPPSLHTPSTVAPAEPLLGISDLELAFQGSTEQDQQQDDDLYGVSDGVDTPNPAAAEDVTSMPQAQLVSSAAHVGVPATRSLSRSSIRDFFRQKELSSGGEKLEKHSKRHSNISSKSSMLKGHSIAAEVPPARIRLRSNESRDVLMTKDDGVAAATSTSHGLRTDNGYYVNLSMLSRYMNPRGYVAHGEDCVDLVAVVTSATNTPARAKNPPKDYFTTFAVSDESLSSPLQTSVEVFRPSKKVLPRADAGDVVLLSSFTVKSRSRNPYLLSNQASGWCVFRFSQSEQAFHGDQGNSDAEELLSGPMVEFHEQERKRAKALRRWWLEREAEDATTPTAQPISHETIPTPDHGIPASATSVQL